MNQLYSGQVGLYEPNYFICGHIATISEDKVSQELFKYFTKTFVKGYKKIGKYYIGMGVLEMASDVRLITMNVNQPQEYDLKIL